MCLCSSCCCSHKKGLRPADSKIPLTGGGSDSSKRHFANDDLEALCAMRAKWGGGTKINTVICWCLVLPQHPMEHERRFMPCQSKFQSSKGLKYRWKGGVEMAAMDVLLLSKVWFKHSWPGDAHMNLAQMQPLNHWALSKCSTASHI